MYKNVIGTSARRPAALLGAATVLAAGALVGATAAPASADGGSTGSASAVNARVKVNVSLSKGSVNVPVEHTLNAVKAPESSEETLLKAAVKGYDNGKPFTFVSAKVANARATTDAKKAEGEAKLVDAKVKLPGLPLTPVLKAELITAKATCAVGAKPVADAKVPGTVVVLGKTVELDLKREADVEVPGVGTVHLALSEETVTSNTAAATAIHLKVDLDPAKAGVATVNGDIVISEAKCQTPGGGDTSGGSTGGDTEGTSGGDTDGATDGSTEGSSSGGNTPGEQSGGGGDLAETGSSGSTIAIGGAGAALIAGGAIALWMKRRGAASRG